MHWQNASRRNSRELDDGWIHFIFTIPGRILFKGKEYIQNYPNGER